MPIHWDFIWPWLTCDSHVWLASVGSPTFAPLWLLPEALPFSRCTTSCFESVHAHRLRRTSLSFSHSLLLSFAPFNIPPASFPPCLPHANQNASISREMTQRLEHIWKTLHPAAAAAAATAAAGEGFSAAGQRDTIASSAVSASQRRRAAGAGRANASSTAASARSQGRPPVG